MPRYEYERPALTVDCVVFGLGEEELEIMLVERGAQPYKGRWALPGGFVRLDEGLKTAAMRELEEETGLENVYLEQLYTFGDNLNRDPRERVVSVAYYALVRSEDHRATAATDAVDARWFTVTQHPPLAFDHEEILATALARLRGQVRYKPIGFELLPEKFTLTQLQFVYESILGQKLDKRNFRRRVLATGLVIQTEEVVENVSHRPPSLYVFDQEQYRKLRRSGFNFEI